VTFHFDVDSVENDVYVYPQSTFQEDNLQEFGIAAYHGYVDLEESTVKKITDIHDLPVYNGIPRSYLRSFGDAAIADKKPEFRKIIEDIQKE
jgi:hypothetical protein